MSGRVSWRGALLCELRGLCSGGALAQPGGDEQRQGGQYRFIRSILCAATACDQSRCMVLNGTTQFVIRYR
jgi:hypothetical protein